MGTNRKPGNRKVIKSNLKTSDRISVIYNDQEVEMSLADFKTYLNSSANKGYKSYVATLLQTGTNAPVATVLENTLGGTVVLGYDEPGGYSLTLAGAFPDATKVTINLPNDVSGVNSISRQFIGGGLTDSDSIYLQTGFINNSTGVMTPSNDVLFGNQAIEIRVYN